MVPIGMSNQNLNCSPMHNMSAMVAICQVTGFRRGGRGVVSKVGSRACKSLQARSIAVDCNVWGESWNEKKLVFHCDDDAWLDMVGRELPEQHYCEVNQVHPGKNSIS